MKTHTEEQECLYHDVWRVGYIRNDTVYQEAHIASSIKEAIDSVVDPADQSLKDVEILYAERVCTLTRSYGAKYKIVMK